MAGPESDPTEIFDSLTNETRVATLQALADAYRESPTDPWIEYSDLQARVGIRDKGNFNYHLRQLDGFVEKRPAGYALSPQGLGLLSAVSAGFYDTDWTWGAVDVPGDCLFCEEGVALRYEDGTLWLTCGTEEHEMGLPAAPALLDLHPETDIVEQVAFLGTQWSALTRRGICSECQGRVEGELEFGGFQPDHYHYHADCQHCGYQHAIPLGLYLLSHPTVWHFYHTHGVDIRTRPFWTLEWCTPGSETVLSTDPLRLAVDISQGDETLRLEIERDGTVVSADHP